MARHTTNHGDLKFRHPRLSPEDKNPVSGLRHLRWAGNFLIKRIEIHPNGL